MSEEKLGKLRGKLKEISEHIDEADQSKTENVHGNVEAIARLEKLEVELQSARRRIQLIQKDLDDTSDRLRTAEEKLGKTTETSEETEIIREELESKEQEGDEAIEEVESNLKEMKRNVELNEQRVGEGARKVKVCENDIARITEKADTYERRVANLEETIENHGIKLDELEEREGESGDREALNEEKVSFLEGQLKETEARSDAAERANAVLNNVLVETETEINVWVTKREDIEKTMIMMDDLADDPAYDLSARYGPNASSAPLTASSLQERSSLWGKKDVEDDEVSVSSRASSRAGRGVTRREPSPPPSPSPEPEPEEEEEEEEEEAPPTPQPEPEAVESEEESEDESEDEDGGQWAKWGK